MVSCGLDPITQIRRQSADRVRPPGQVARMAVVRVAELVDKPLTERYVPALALHRHRPRAARLGSFLSRGNAE